MGAPITWQNVNGPSPAQASAPLSSASQTFNDAFASLRGVLQEREAVDNANWQNQKANNTTSFLDTVAAKYKTPEALAAAQQSGELDQLRQSFGTQIDADKVRGAADARMVALQQQAREGLAYQHMMTDERVAPILDKYKAAILKPGGGGNDEAQALQAEYAKLGGRNLADLSKAADDRGWQINERGMALDKHGMDLRVGQSTIDHQRATEQTSLIQANAQASQAASQAASTKYIIDSGTADRATAKAAGQAAAVFKALDTSGNMYGSDGIYTGGKADELYKYMRENKVAGDNSDKQAHLMDRLTEIQKNGIQATSQNGKRILNADGTPLIIHDLPMAAIKQALTSAGDPVNWTVNPWQINKGPADNFEEALKKIVGSAVVDEKGNAKVKALQDLLQYNDATTRVTENAAPIRSVGTPIVHPKRK
jgi:hypothetical protein